MALTTPAVPAPDADAPATDAPEVVNAPDAPASATPAAHVPASPDHAPHLPHPELRATTIPKMFTQKASTHEGAGPSKRTLLNFVVGVSILQNKEWKPATMHARVRHPSAPAFPPPPKGKGKSKETFLYRDDGETFGEILPGTAGLLPGVWAFRVDDTPCTGQLAIELPDAPTPGKPGPLTFRCRGPVLDCFANRLPPD